MDVTPDELKSTEQRRPDLGSSLEEIAASTSALNHLKEDDPSTRSSGRTAPEVEQRTITGVRWFLVCAGIFSANVLYGLDNTIAADIQADVSSSLNNVTQLGWLGFGFSLGSTVAILPLGKIYTTFDVKWVFIGCLLNFVAGSALCGAAPDMNAMIIGRVWAGAGGAGMYLGSLNLSTMCTTPKEQPFYIGLTGAFYGAGCILGPVVGGLLADSSAGWRWAFYLNPLVCAAMAPIYLFALPPLPTQTEKSWLRNLKQLDWLGAALTAVIYTTFTLAFSFGGSLWKWSDGGTVTMIVLFALSTVIFCITQARGTCTNKMDRLFPCEFLRNRQLILLYITMACGGAALFVSVYYIPLYYLFVYGDSGTKAAVRLLPFICFYVVTIILCGAVMNRKGYHMLWYLSCGIFLTVGGALMYTVNRNTSDAKVYGYTVLVGIGMACTQAGYAVAPYYVRSERSGEVIQFLNISQGSSQLIGLVIASAIFQAQTFSGLSSELSSLGYTDAEIQTAVAGARSRIFKEISPEFRDRLLDVIVQSIADAWILVIAAGALWTVSSLFLDRKRFPTGTQSFPLVEKEHMSRT